MMHGMFRRRIQIKLFAVFVTAFVCLNASGAACLAYCQTFDIQPEKEDCPLRKLSADCDKTAETASPSFGLDSHGIDCCPMAVSFFSAPAEARSFSFETAQAVELPRYLTFEPKFIVTRAFTATYDYRGPPPLDRRPDRIKHRLLLI